MDAIGQKVSELMVSQEHHTSCRPESTQCALFIQARAMANEELNLQYNNMRSSSSVTAAIATPMSRILSSGHAATNFVYGEILFESFSRVLKRVTTKPGGFFMDCGCGAGAAVCVAALCSYSVMSSTQHVFDNNLLLESATQTSTSGIDVDVDDQEWKIVPFFSRVLGADLMHSKVEEGTLLLQHLNKLEPALDIISRCKIVLCDFLESDWRDADIVYICATCFTPSLLALLFSKLCLLKPGAQVILLDKEIAFIDGISTDLKLPLMQFEFQFSEQCETTWGYGLAHVYTYCAPIK
jgi:hypothetical protein